jgi:hypothetical protein
MREDNGFLYDSLFCEWGCALVATYPLYELPTDEEFLKLQKLDSE